ncbi:MAG: amidohydrolase [Methanosarcinales archaeon]|nr:amidohydrolase [Methanosarcinales archaeon]
MLQDVDNIELRNWIVELRREFHRIPEQSFFEFKTQQKILEILQQVGLKGKIIAKTGVIALINGNGPGKSIALRADMDGLEVTEETTQLNREYISQIPGFMHSCGHDGHMAIVLGAARLLNQCRGSFPGSVRLIFQPAEEQPPGGALEIIDEGGLDRIDAILGHHILSSIDAGKIKLKPGPFMATSNIMTVRITGKGGHHLDPRLYIDPISIASKFVGLIQDEIKKQIPEDRFIIGFGKISGGSQFNRTPDEVEILGSFRTFDKNNTRLIEDIIKHTLENLMQSYSREEYPGLPKFELDILHGYPVLINEPAFSNQVLKVLKRGFHNVGDDIDPFFGAEDFAYYLQKVPGVYIGLGTRNEEKGIIEGNHSSRFDIDEDILLVGTRMLTTIVLDFLNNPEEYFA